MAAKGLAQQLVASQPANAEWNRLVYASCFRMGDVLDSQGHREQAHAEYQTAREIVDRFVQQPSDNINWPLNQVIIHSKIGDVYKVQEKPAMARQHYDLALSIAKELALRDPPHKSDPLKRDARHHLSATHNRIGQILDEQGDLDGALERFQAAMGIFKELAEVDPGPGRQITLAVRHSRLGTVLTKLKRFDEAQTQFRSAFEIRSRLAEMDSTNFAYVDYLASSYGDMGNVLKESNQLNDAILKYQKALDLRESLANKDPENQFWQRNLLALQKKFADTRVEYFLERARALKAEAKLEEAIELYRKALADSEMLVQKDSKSTAWQKRLQEVRKELEAATIEQRKSAEQDRRSEPRLPLNRSSA